VSATPDARPSPLAGLPRPVAYVLSGGGSLGAMQVGMVRGMAPYGLDPDLIVGASVGAINGALIALDPPTAPARLSEIWGGVGPESVFPGSRLSHLVTLARHRTHLCDPGALRALIATHAEGRSFADLAVPLAVTAVDASSGEVVTLDQGPLAPALLASSAIPGIFPPVALDGKLLYDGGIAGNVPLRTALAAGARSLVVLDCRLVQLPNHVPRNALQAFGFSLAVMAGRPLWDQLADLSSQVPIVYLPGPSGTDRSPFRFDHTAELVETCEQATDRFLAQLKVDGPGLYGQPQATVPLPRRRRWRR